MARTLHALELSAGFTDLGKRYQIIFGVPWKVWSAGEAGMAT